MSRNTNIALCPTFMPRFIRMRHAPQYVGMDRNRFNRDVRPYVPNIRIGTQGIAFDRVDLDDWADEYKNRNGCPAARSGRRKLWETEKRQGSSTVMGSGTSRRGTEEYAFAKALRRAKYARPRKT
jgi:hypothetical protein